MSKRELILFCKEKEKENYCVFYVKEDNGVSRVYSKYYYTGIKLLKRLPKKKIGIKGLIKLGACPELQRFIGEEKAKVEVLVERMITQMGIELDMKNLNIIRITELKT